MSATPHPSSPAVSYRLPVAALAVALALVGLAVFAGMQRSPPCAAGAPGVACLGVEVLRAWDHPCGHYTQGLEYHDGLLYESAGGYGESALVRYALGSAEIERRPLPARLFGEGLTRSGARLLQLTWREGVLLSWRAGDLAPLEERRYQGDGWGLCDDGRRLVMSNGSEHLTLRDPESFAPVGELTVTLGARPVSGLNELECVGGDIYANVWPTDRILRIDGATGAVTAVIDAAGLLPEPHCRGTDVLNGIAYRPDTGTFLLTGKYWPFIYETRFVER
jgi:glutaminyl-peptide cyclotransferase